jgi:phosphoribosylformylglycinamidine synthase
VREHGLSEDEYRRFTDLIGREPTIVELGIVSAMWNEHCSYKSSRLHLRTLPTSGAHVIQGPGENAGVIDIGDGLACVFKMESHNHPSFIEPYQGAATGVGGILRDVFTMGARPIAALNALRFGAPDHPRTRHLVAGVAAGIGGYGNSFGVPTVGGSVGFHTRYDGNILVNAMAVGLARRTRSSTRPRRASGTRSCISARKRAETASMAPPWRRPSSTMRREKRPTVQVGDPFAEKLLLEACLELMASGAVVAIQDMGAAGLTCRPSRWAPRAISASSSISTPCPTRESGMSAYEMMLSESQGAHAHGAGARPRGGRRGDLPQMAARLRRDRAHD